jgi:DNA-binding XRE family transcriptional regulator
VAHIGDTAASSERLQHVLGGRNVLGEALRAARRQRGYTQTRLAQLVGVSRRHIAGIEAGANPTMAVFLAIVKVFPGIPFQFGDFVVMHLERR